MEMLQEWYLRDLLLIIGESSNLLIGPFCNLMAINFYQECLKSLLFYWADPLHYFLQIMELMCIIQSWYTPKQKYPLVNYSLWILTKVKVHDTILWRHNQWMEVVNEFLLLAQNHTILQHCYTWEDFKVSCLCERSHFYAYEPILIRFGKSCF